MRPPRMRINIVLGPFISPPPAPAGAVEKRWSRMARLFAEHGHEVTVLCRDHPDLPREKILDGVRWLRLKGATRTGSIYLDILKDFPYARRARRALPPADITVTNSFWLPAILRRPGHWGVLNAHIARVPKGQIRLYRHASRISTVSSHIAELIKAEVPDLANCVSFINNPVDTDVFVPSATTGDPRVICYTGRVHPEKGLVVLAGAVRRLREQDPAWRVKIVGDLAIERGGGGESYRAEILKAAGNPDAVEFVGAIRETEKLADAVRACRYYVYPSLAKQGEAFGIAPLEAMAAGVPPIVSELEVFRDFITEDVNGIVARLLGNNAAENLAQSIQRLDSNPETYQRLRNNGIATAQNFDYPKTAKKYLDDFELLTEARRASISVPSMPGADQRPLRITIVLGPFIPPLPGPAGAIEKLWCDLGRVFVNRGHKVTMICRDHPELPREDDFDGLQWLRVPGQSRSGSIWFDLLRDFPYSRRAYKVLPDADITITNCFWLPIMMRKQRHWGLTNVHVQRVPKKQMRLYGHAPRISTASSHLADLIRAELPSRRKEIVRFFTNPVDTEVFHPGEVPGDNRRICYTGRVHPEKGIEQLARAVGLLRKSDPQWRLLVVGHTDVGLGGGGEPYKQRIIDAIGSKDAVEFTGGIRDPSELADCIRSCRYYCYPSLARKGEACPVAPLEALAAGVPPIVSELDQFLDYIEPNVNGIVVPMEPKGSELRLAEAIKALDEDPERYDQLRVHAVESAQKFAYEAVADRYIEDFKFIMKERSKST